MPCWAIDALLLLAAALVPLRAQRVFFASPGSLQACLDALQRPGDECRLRPGRYRAPSASKPFTLRGKHGSASAPIVVAPAAGVAPGEVVFDGTIPISGWEPVGAAAASAASAAPTVYRTVLPQPVWQLFDRDGELQIPARWPDAFFHDKSVFQGPERWAHSTTGHHDLNNASGLLIDAGECETPSDCCAHW